MTSNNIINKNVNRLNVILNNSIFINEDSHFANLSKIHRFRFIKFDVEKLLIVKKFKLIKM